MGVKLSLFLNKGHRTCVCVCWCMWKKEGGEKEKKRREREGEKKREKLSVEEGGGPQNVPKSLFLSKRALNMRGLGSSFATSL